MPRLDKLDEVLFPVEEHAVFVSVPNGKTERRLPVPGKKAIVNAKDQRVLGIVSDGYRLVTNQQALDWGHECCRTVFPETKPTEWEVTATDAPGTAGYCHIDLRHNSTALDFKDLTADKRPDVFGPFIRVTNSYNGLRALSFDIGFYRKVCKNGMIIPDTIIRFSFTHQRRDIGETIQFKVEHDRLTKFRTAFTDSLAGLRACNVPRPQFDPLVRSVLLLRPPQPMEPDTREADDWQNLAGHLDKMTDRYIGELGANAYAAFNVITEFASHPPVNRCVHRDRHSFQRLAGTWLSTFSQECRKPGFTVAKYLEEQAKAAKPENQ
ncbi:MAG TPA: DUF932 domain-containing protein [Verrucomicrobiae bacterium]|nr:DUF932 domain-containing protein [Verrucomicrobiae bacterium]